MHSHMHIYMKVVFTHAVEAKIYYTLNLGDDWAVQEFSVSTINPRTLLWNPMEDHWIIAHDSENARVRLQPFLISALATSDLVLHLLTFLSLAALCHSGFRCHLDRVC